MKFGKLPLFFTVLIALFVLFKPVEAATYTVVNTNDSGAGSLREAIDTANSTPADDTISFSIPGCPAGVCTIQLQTGQLTVGSGNLTMFNSTGAEKLRIFGRHDDEVFFRVMEVQSGAELTIEGISISNGGTYQINGGGIHNSGALNLRNSIVSSNLSIGGTTVGNGGGIYNTFQGSLSLLRTTIADNDSQGVFGGGGIYNNGGTVVITDSWFSNNRAATYATAEGAGILSYGSLTVTNTTFSGNIANHDGGGLSAGGSLVITDSRFISNVSGGGGGLALTSGTGSMTNSIVRSNNGYYVGGGVTVSGSGKNPTNFTLTGSTISDNVSGSGAGLNNEGATVTVRNSLIDNNTYDEIAGAGGGISNRGTMLLANTTLTRNLSAIGCSGVSNEGLMTVINSTIARNRIEGEYSTSGLCNFGDVTMRNSIVADNPAVSAPDIFQGLGSFTSKGNNLIGNTETEIPIAWQPSDILNQSARLAPIGSYGGATQTMAVTGNSPALNNGNNCVITANGCGDNNPSILVDARGAARVGNVDIGAFELNSSGNGGTYKAITPDGKVNSPFTFVISSDSLNFSLSQTGGTLPSGLSLINSLPGFSKMSFVVPQAGSYSISGTPSSGGIFNYTITATNGTDSVSTDYTTLIQAAPTASNVSIGGRVATMEGRGVASAAVVITDASGARRRTLTNQFGYYRFDDVAAGRAYTIQVSAKRYNFSPRIVSVGDELTDVNFTPEQ